MALLEWFALKSTTRSRLKTLRSKREVRAAAVLTNGYVASDSVDISGFREAAVYFTLVAGSLTSFEYQIQQSIDEGVTWHNIGAETVTLPFITDGIPYYTIPAADQNWFKVFRSVGEQMRILAQGTGTVTGSTLALSIVGVN